MVDKNVFPVENIFPSVLEAFEKDVQYVFCVLHLKKKVIEECTINN